jgi:hypothetical protein
MSIGQIFGSAAVNGILFILLSHPITYKLTNKLYNTWNEGTKCPTNYGHLFHVIIFFILSLLLKIIFNMTESKYDRKGFGVLLKFALYCTLLFFVISGKETYEITGGLSKGVLANGGCATGWGISTHGIIFFLITFLAMLLPNDCD